MIYLLIAALLFFSTSLCADNTTVVIQPLLSSPAVMEFLSFAPSSTSIKDGYVYRFSLNGFPYIRNTYLMDVNSTQSNFSARVGILRLVEFNDTVGPQQSKYNCTFTEKTKNFSPFNTEDISPYANTTVFNVSTTYTGDGRCAGLQVGLDIFLTSNLIYISTAEGMNATQLITNGAKFTLRINNYPYQLSNSKLALYFAFFTRKARVIGLESVETLPNTVATARLEYSPIALINGNLGPVVASDLLEPDGTADVPTDDGRDITESYNIIYFVFDVVQPKSIVWDPMIAVFPLNSQSSESSQLVMQFGLFFASVLALLFIY